MCSIHRRSCFAAADDLPDKLELSLEIDGCLDQDCFALRLLFWAAVKEFRLSCRYAVLVTGTFSVP